MKELITKLERRLHKLNSRLKILEGSHVGNELNFTYWGGYDMGELRGVIREIENTLEALNYHEKH